MSESIIQQAEHNGHYLSFNERVHRYTLDGRSVPGVTTFTKGGYPTSEGLLSWMLSRTADSAVRLGLEEARAATPPSEARIKELVKEAKKKPDELANAAADIGTVMHDYAYKTELGDLEGAAKVLADNAAHPDIEKVMKCVGKFTEWYSKTRDVIVASEAIVALPCGFHASKEDRNLWVNKGLLPFEGPCLCYAGKFDRLVTRGNKLILSDFKSASGVYVEQYHQLAAYKAAIEYWMGRKVDGLEILRFGKDNGEFEEVLMDDPEEMRAMEEQAMRCRETFEHKKQWSKDKRFAFIPTKKK